MDELIWKYLDDCCSDEEKKFVLNQLDTNSEFRQLFLYLSELNADLEKNAYVSMPVSLKNTLEYKYIHEWSPVFSSEPEILSLKWTIPLSVLALAALVLSLYFSDSAPSILTFFPKLDEKITILISMTTFGFILLKILDSFINKMREAGKLDHIFTL